MTNTSTTTGHPALHFPPYGAVSSEFRRVADTVGAPPRFAVAGRAGTVVEWENYLRRELATMADFLWPVFDGAQRNWVGKATSQMDSLTRADLGLMAGLSAHLQKEASAAGHGLGRNHLELFKAEDVSARPTLSMYLPGLDATELERLDASIVEWFAGAGDAHIRFKARFQRPRPHQMAYLLDPTGTFDFRHATSAVTPSMISGHAFQGLVYRCGGYVAQRGMLEANLGAVDRLQQYAVDIGDRRVFAGVHYPSDNLSSWYCGLRLCDHFFGKAGQEAKDFMWRAIQRSIVYGAIDEASKQPHSPFKGPMDCLREEAQRPTAVSGN